MRRNQPRGPSNASRSALLVLARLCAAHLPRLHQASPVPPPLHGQGRVPHGQQHHAELAGAHRRRQRRQGHGGRARRRRPRGRRGDDADRQEGPAAPRRRARCTSARASSSRATSSSTCSPARRRAPTLGDGDTIPINQTAAPVQLDQVLTALQSDTRDDLQALLRRVLARALGRGRRGLQPLDRVLEAGLPRLARSSPTPSSASPSTTSRATSTTPARSPARWTAVPRRSCKSLDHRLQHDRARVRRRAAAARAARSTSCRARCAPAAGAGRAQRRVPAAARASSPTCARPCAPPGPALDAGVPFVAPAARPGLRARAARPGRATCGRPSRRWRGSTPRRVPLYEQVRAGRRAARTRSILPWTQGQDPGQDLPGRPGKVYEESTKPLAGLAGESRSGDANGQWFRVLAGGGNFAYPLGTDSFFLTSAPLLGRQPAEARQAAAAAARRPVRDPAGARPAHDPRAGARGRSRRRSPRAGPGRLPARSSTAAVKDCARAIRARGRSTGRLPVSDRADHARRARRRGARLEEEAGDDARSASTPATSRAIIGLAVIAARRRRLHPGPPAPALPGRRGQAVQAQGRVLHRAGGHAGPGPDRPRRPACASATSPRSTSRTAARS